MKPSKFDAKGASAVVLADVSAGEQLTTAAADGGRVSVMPGTTEYLYIAPNSTVTIAATGSVGGIDQWILQALFNVTTAAGSLVTVTDGNGLDGGLADWPLLEANKLAGVYEKTYEGMRSKIGAWTIKTGTGVAVTLAICV